MSIVRFIVVAFVFIVLLLVSLDNAQTVTLRFFRLYSLEAPLVFVVLCTFVAGTTLGLIAGALRNARLKRELRRLRRSTARRDDADAAGDAALPMAPPFDAL